MWACFHYLYCNLYSLKFDMLNNEALNYPESDNNFKVNHARANLILKYSGHSCANYYKLKTDTSYYEVNSEVHWSLRKKL